MKTSALFAAVTLAFAGAAFAAPQLPNVPANDNMQQANPKAATSFRDLANKTRHGAHMAMDKVTGKSHASDTASAAPSYSHKSHGTKHAHAGGKKHGNMHAKAGHKHGSSQVAMRHHGGSTSAMGGSSADMSRQHRMDMAYADWQRTQGRR